MLQVEILVSFLKGIAFAGGVVLVFGWALSYFSDKYHWGITPVVRIPGKGKTSLPDPEDGQIFINPRTEQVECACQEFNKGRVTITPSEKN